MQPQLINRVQTSQGQIPLNMNINLQIVKNDINYNNYLLSQGINENDSKMHNNYNSNPNLKNNNNNNVNVNDEMNSLFNSNLFTQNETSNGKPEKINNNLLLNVQQSKKK